MRSRALSMVLKKIGFGQVIKMIDDFVVELHVGSSKEKTCHMFRIWYVVHVLAASLCLNGCVCRISTLPCVDIVSVYIFKFAIFTVHVFHL